MIERIDVIVTVITIQLLIITISLITIAYLLKRILEEIKHESISKK